MRSVASTLECSSNLSAYMSHCDKYTKIERMLQALQFMSVKQKLYYSVCVFIDKILNNMLPGVRKKVCFMKELKCIIPCQPI